MKVKGRFDHFNINVTDLDKSIKFYETAIHKFLGNSVLIVRKLRTVPSCWCIWPMTTAISCWN